MMMTQTVMILMMMTLMTLMMMMTRPNHLGQWGLSRIERPSSLDCLLKMEHVST